MNIFTDKSEKKKLELEDYTIVSEDFSFVNEGKTIHDEKFATKPTTFFKDALKRFRKNKSSVVGAFILGFLVLLAIFVPIISQNEIDSPLIQEAYLAPKLFKSGTGFWDGTRKYKNIVYDTENDCPADFYNAAVSKLKVDSNPTLINQANKYGHGGYIIFTNPSTSASAEGYDYFRSTKTKFSTTGNYCLSFKLGSDDGVNGGSLGEYAVYLVSDTVELCLKDWSKDYSDCTINISQKMALTQVSSTVSNASIEFRLKNNSSINTYLLIKEVMLTSTDGNEDLAEISFDDATQAVLIAPNVTTGTTPKGYWVSTGIKNIYNSEIYYCSFRYDTYAAAYDKTSRTIAISTLDTYQANGWCKFDKNDIVGTFEVLDEDKCPIESIDSVTYNRVGKPIEVSASAYRYREYGYKSMPSFIFGTDDKGHDIFKKAFSGLRTSLILGICTAAFCLMFGLCWGAISGYFGGNVDLVMERFCDILGGVPWIVIMTLCILHFGNNFFTFFLALCMTGWMGTAGRTRTQFYRFKGREYVLASRTLGASDMRLIFRHILPNALGTIVTSSVLMIPSTIFSEASLAYLNLGLQGVQSFGVMLADNQKYISTYPNLILFPAVILALMMISFNLFGNGLRDALNPSLKGSD